MKNKFTIDLSVIDLTAEQCKSIESAIQKSVSTELSKIQTKGKISFLPLPKPKGGIGEGHGETMGFRANY